MRKEGGKSAINRQGLCPDVAAARLRFVPRLISPKSVSISISFPEVSCEMAFPRPVRACGWTPPPFALRLCPLVFPCPFGGAVEVRGKGKGDGNSSTDREFGLGTGTTVAESCCNCPVLNGVGGGDVPNLLRSFRVMCGRDCESSAASKFKGKKPFKELKENC